MTRRYYAIVTPFYPTPRAPQLCNFVSDQVKAIGRLSSLEPVVFASCYTEPATLDGIRIEPLRVKSFPSYLFNGWHNRANGKEFLRALNRASISPEDIYAVHAHTTQYGAMALALKQADSNIITLLQHHDLDPLMIVNGIGAGLWPNLLYRALTSRKVIEQIDLNVAVSNAALEHLLDMRRSTPSALYSRFNRLQRSLALRSLRSPRPRRAMAIINGVDPEKFFPGQSIAPANSFTIGIIANYQPRKGHIILIRAIAELKRRGYNNIRLLSVGADNLNRRAGIASEAARLGLDNVEFIDSIPHSELRDFMLGLNLFVMPSIYEGFGCVYSEAAACGVPFIGIEKQGVADIVKPEEAHLWLAKPADHIDLADKIEQQIKNPQTFHPAQPLDIDFHVNRLLTAVSEVASELSASNRYVRTF
ncbi:MAG: glycosyltransferase family 4 protein [Muribaculaceae bacterium]|nr:glycosyltransferase family 4 protein [Muribaculaceae bacterium]